MTDPTRWLDEGAELDPDERRIFSAGLRGRDVPADAKREVWRGLSRKLPALAAGAALTAAAKAAAGSGVNAGASGSVLGIGAGVSALLKPFGVGLLLGGAVAGGVAMIDGRTEPVSDRSSPASAAPAGSPGPRASAARRGPAFAPETAHPSSVASVPSSSRATPNRGAVNGGTTSLAPAVVSEPVRGAAPPSSEPSQRSFAVDEPSASPPDAESRSVAAARGLLRAGNAGAALGELEAARRRFPNGVLEQEREALTIEALRRSGDRDSARRRAGEFLRRFPQSPHAGTVREALE